MWKPIPDVKPKDTDLHVESHRLEVPGGWIVRTIISRHGAGANSSQVFVPDQNHEWELE